MNKQTVIKYKERADDEVLRDHHAAHTLYL